MGCLYFVKYDFRHRSMEAILSGYSIWPSRVALWLTLKKEWLACFLIAPLAWKWSSPSCTTQCQASSHICVYSACKLLKYCFWNLNYAELRLSIRKSKFAKIHKYWYAHRRSEVIIRLRSGDWEELFIKSNSITTGSTTITTRYAKNVSMNILLDGTLRLFKNNR